MKTDVIDNRFIATIEQKRRTRLIVIFWSIAIILGALQAWAHRYYMDPDGISYLDMGDAYLRGDWNMAINAEWSPLYSWLLGLALFFFKPAPYWEFFVVKFVNFAIYLCALGCFHFFLLGLMDRHQSQLSEVSESKDVTIPVWAWLALGYTLFIWSSLTLITISETTPDMCVAAFVYLASGLILRIQTEATSWLTFALLGVVLGLGYLAKAPMLPLTFIFLGVSMLSVGNLRRALPRVLIALVVFLSIGGPFALALSHIKGRWTFGDSGKLNYAYHVNNVSHYADWQGEIPEDGIPKHPTRKIFAVPAIFEFAAPVGGTYPAWYDPSYWYEGVVVHFDLKEQLWVLASNLKIYLDLFLSTQGALIVGFLILYLMGSRRWLCLKDIIEQWRLLVPAIAALGMYALVHLEPRYTGPFVVLLWMGIASAVRLPDSPESRRLIACVMIAMLAVMTMTIGTSTPAFRTSLASAAYSTAHDLIRGQDASAHVQWQVANNLIHLGVQTGDKVAVIGDSFRASSWARLARVQIIAEIPKYRNRAMDEFWAADPLVKSQAIRTFATTGAKVIVAEWAPPDAATAAGWQKLGNTPYYVYVLTDHSGDTINSKIGLGAKANVGQYAATRLLRSTYEGK